ncbi:MAG: hypothetical protein AAF387_17625, partial [Pseudomonadota bacterium]
VFLGLSLSISASSAVGQQTNFNFGSEQITFLDPTASKRYEWTSGDSLIANIDIAGKIGSITGSKNKVVIPEVKVFGNTIVPEVRADTRTGLRFTTDIDAYAGVVFSAGMTTGGNGISASINAGPQLSLPSQVRAGRFFDITGTTDFGANSSFDLGLPTLDAGLDVVIGGEASGKLEYGLFPLTGYTVGNFDFNLPDITLPVFDFNLDLNLPKLPDFGFLPSLPDFSIPDIIPESDKDDALFRKQLPTIDPLKPGAPPTLLSAGEVVLVNPAASAQSTTETDGNALVKTTKGDLLRLGIDIDGIISYATTGVSFTGLEVQVKPGTVNLATVGYDTIDVKYGIEVGYELESRLDTYLQATLNFVDPITGAPVDVLVKDSGGSTASSSYSGRWDQLPDLALLNDNDVQIDVDFTGLERAITQKGALTLGDYMELKALSAKASVLGGIASINLGPLFYKKLELAGEFAAFDIFEDTLVLSDLGLVDGLWDGSVLIDAIENTDTYMQNAPASLNDPSTFSRLDDHTPLADFSDKIIGIGIGSNSSTSPDDYQAVDFVDEGIQTKVRSEVDVTISPILGVVGGKPGIGGFPIKPGPGTPGGNPCGLICTKFSLPVPVTNPDVSEIIHAGGLLVGEGSTYTNKGVRRFNLFSIENDGEINNDGWLDIDGDQVVISGSGTIFFGAKDDREGDASGSLVAKGIVNGEGHTLDFSGDGKYGDPLTANEARELARQVLDNNLIKPLPIIPGEPSAKPTSQTHTVERNAAVDFNGYQALTRDGHQLGSSAAGSSFQNRGTLNVRGATLHLSGNTQVANDETGLIEVRDGAWKNGSSNVFATGLLDINSSNIDFVNKGEFYVHGNSTGIVSRDIDGGDSTAGLFRAGAGGEIVVRRFGNDPTNTLDDKLNFIAEDGGVIDFQNQVDVVSGAHVLLKTELGGTINLNGLERGNQSSSIMIENFGLLDVQSGRSSLRPTGGALAPCVGACPPPPPPAIEPIDLNNQGTVRIHAGAVFGFDVEITDYREGGASFDGGTWELLGANTRFFNTGNISNPSQTAVMDIQVREVFGNAGNFDDLIFDELRNDNGEVVSTSDIGTLDTRLVYNNANVTLSGAAKFDYFNTVEVNRGTLNLRNQHQFNTASSFTNEGGTTSVESGAGLHLNGPLFVNGGNVSFTGNSEFSVTSQLVEQTNGELARRSVEVNGGALFLEEGTKVSDSLINRSRTDGLLLRSGHAWVVRDSVTTNELGEEVITPGLIDLDIKSNNGVAGVARNDGYVEIAGSEAKFEGLEETLLYQHGTLVVSDGKIYESPNNYFRNANTTEIKGGQFLIENGQFRNDGALLVDENSFLSVDFFNLLTGTADIAGVVNANHTFIDLNNTSLFLSGLLKTQSLELPDNFSLSGLELNGGTLLTESLNGSLTLLDTVFAPGQSIGSAVIEGDYAQSGESVLQIEWGQNGADYLEILGTASLGGKLEVKLLDDFIPEIGESIEFLAAQLFLGGFDLENLITPAGINRAFAFRTAAGKGFLDVMAAPVPLPPAFWLFACALIPLIRQRR